MKITKIPSYVCTAITAVAILGLWTTGSLAMLSPGKWSWLALSGYAFPVFLVAMVCLLVLWTVLRQWKMLLATVVGFVVAYFPVTLYCPVHMESEVPHDAIQLMTYNTDNWGRDYHNELDKQEAHKALLSYIVECNPDIVCVQEGYLGGDVQHYIDSIVKPRLQYVDSVICNNKGHAQLVILSRFPITRKEDIPYKSPGNGSAAFWLSVNGREVIVVNNHLQSMGFTRKDRAKFHDLVHGEEESDSVEQTSHTIFGKILKASRKRAPQARAVAKFVRKHKGTPIIVCGDFNDLPLSYTHRTMAQDLVDCYETTGMGPGFSLTKYGMRVRIDNILCSENLQPYNCFTDNDIDLSDHYPMRCWLTFK